MIRAKMIIEGSPSKIIKGFSDFVKESLIKLIVDWHKDTLPEHFKPKAAQSYEYKPRTKSYMIRKARTKHHQRPLEFSGESRKQRERMIRVSGTSKKATGRLNAPRYFWMTPTNHPKKGEELVTVIEAESNDMAQRLHRSISRKIDQVKDKKVVK